MLGLLVVTHGRLAEDIVNAASTILGPLDGVEAVSIDWNDDMIQSTARLREAIARLDRGRGVLVLTDMFGGTPTNLAVALHDPGRLEVVTGVNLAMIVKHHGLRDTAGLVEAAERVAAQGRESIQVASRLLGRPAGSPRAETP